MLREELLKRISVDPSFRRHLFVLVIAVAIPWSWCACGGRKAVQQGNAAEAIRDAEPVVQIGHPGYLRDVVFSPDRTLFLTTAFDSQCGNDRNVLLWDADSGDKLRAFPADTHGLKPLFCLDGRAVVIGGNVWDIQTGNQRLTVLKSKEVPVDARISADTRRLVVGTQCGKVRAVDLKTGKTIGSLSAAQCGDRLAREQNTEQTTSRNAYHVEAVGFTSVNVPLALLADSGRDRVAIWNVATGEEQSEFKISYCDSTRFSPDACYVVTRYWSDTGSSDETTVVYDASTGKKILSSEEWMYDSDSVKFTPDGRHCVTGSSLRRATLWNLKSGQAVRHFGGHVRSIYAMRLLEAGKVLETRSYDVAQRWDLNSGELLKSFRDPSFSDSPKTSWPPVRPVVVPSPDGKTFICRNKVIDTETGKPLRTLSRPISKTDRFKRHSYSIKRAIYTPNGKMVILDYGNVHHESRAVLFDAASGKFVRRLAMKPVWQYGLQWSRDGRRALTVPDGLHRLWDVERGRPLQTIGTVAERTLCLSPQIAFSANGKYVYIYGRQFGVFFWNAETGKALHHDPPGQAAANKRALLDGEKHREYYLGRSAVSPDRRYAASRYQDAEDRKHKILIWDIEKGRVARTLDHAPLMPTAPFFSPKGRYLAVVCGHPDQEIVMWDLKSGEKLYSLRPQRINHWHGFPSVCFLPDGQRMLANSAQKELTLHDVKTGKLIHRMIDTHPAPKGCGERFLQENLLLSPDGRYAVANYDCKYAIVWNLQTGEQTQSIQRKIGNISRYFHFSDDGRELLTRYKPATLWNLETGEVRVFGEREATANLDGFSSQVKKPVKSAEQQTVPKEILDQFQDRLPENVGAVEQTGDGRRLIVYHNNGCMVFWDIATEEPVYRCYLFHNGGRWLTVTPDGRCYGNLEYVRYRKPGTIETIQR